MPHIITLSVKLRFANTFKPSKPALSMISLLYVLFTALCQLVCRTVSLLIASKFTVSSCYSRR